MNTIWENIDHQKRENMEEEYKRVRDVEVPMELFRNTAYIYAGNVLEKSHIHLGLKGRGESQHGSN